ncbi:MAG TPA: hypothetical protein DCL31_10650, partial [Clostridium sp.]|nr:hypothetical protein [Clostridium sp.]
MNIRRANTIIET